MPTTQFDPVWISSEEHLAEYRRIIGVTSWLGILFFGYQMRNTFPALRMKFMWVPIVHFCSGTLEISDSGVRFESVPISSPLPKYRGVREDLRFTLTPRQVKSVQWAHTEPVPLKYYTPPFIRIDAHQSDGGPKSFLICAGATGPFIKKMRERTEAMFEELMTFVP